MIVLRFYILACIVLLLFSIHAVAFRSLIRPTRTQILRLNGDQAGGPDSTASSTKKALMHQFKYLSTMLPIMYIMEASISSSFAEEMTEVGPNSTTMEVPDTVTAAKFAEELERNRGLNSDEFVVEFQNTSLGLKLTETIYKGFPIVTVKEIADSSLRSEHPELEPGAIVVQIAGVKVDGTPLGKIVEIVQKAERPLLIKFRDPSRFFRQLDSTIGLPRRVVSTSYLPANARDVGATEQQIIVERLSMPPADQRTRAAQLLDVMEIQYVAQVQSDSDGKIVDSSAERSAPGTSAKSIYYVLGQQNGPPGKLPPGWDLTLRGMVVGEKRRISLPYTLAYDRKGDKEHNIPPFATMIYTVKLVSLT
mmetsp:Transcript_20021/g.34052  ORF Transcript_20021/g.34052 Transcript_20021/m.34052 type:complete len:364 (+) Transcript_20021:1905-2996(+)